ncbi:MAG TPA: hypothetical protein VKU79_06505 [Thermoplasmataceae archaeon]|nr:hypothetical protein [Thermoplasmataceae archaeon]
MKKHPLLLVKVITMAAINSRKKSIIAYSEIPLFFSLVDYRNNYFMSDDPKKIIEFYNGFENRDQLIEWMKARPKGVATIHEVEGDKDIIVVIPTADFNGKYAKECRENIFKGLHIVFVESGEAPDPYFNYAHNCNVGIRKAMEYNPKWVVVSNDDMVYVDQPSQLKLELSKVSVDNDVIFVNQTQYHSNSLLILKIRKLYFARMKLSKNRVYSDLLIRFSIRHSTIIKNFRSLSSRLYYLIYYKKFLLIRRIGSFGIFSSKFITKLDGKLFDEIYINHQEDDDLSLNIFANDAKIGFIDYSVGDLIGGTIARGEIRALRSLASQAYFEAKNLAEQ